MSFKAPPILFDLKTISHSKGQSFFGAAGGGVVDCPEVSLGCIKFVIGRAGPKSGDAPNRSPPRSMLVTMRFGELLSDFSSSDIPFSFKY